MPPREGCPLEIYPLERSPVKDKEIGSMHQLLQNPYPTKVDESLLGSRIEYLSEFGLYYEREEEANKDLRWCSSIVERMCDGTWINPGNMSQCYKEGEAADCFGVQYLNAIWSH